MERYQNLLGLIKTHARTEHTKGRSSDAAAASLKLPKSLGDISYFRNGFHEIAMDTWFRKLGKT